MAEAMAHTFEIRELRESILFQLPQKDLLLSQAVCVTWKETITLSPMLQQKLFFRPISNPDQQPELNPLLQDLFPLLFTLQECPIGFGYFLNGLPFMNDMIKVPEIRKQEWFQDARQRNAVLREDASWRKMYPVQPPAQIGKVIQGGGCDAYESLEHGVITPEFQHLQTEGAWMGLIYDIIVQELVDHKQAGIHVEWHMFPFLRRTESEIVGEITDSPQTRPDAVLKNRITIYAGFPCKCDCNSRDDEKYDATGIQVARCNTNLLKWDIIKETQ